MKKYLSTEYVFTMAAMICAMVFQLSGKATGQDIACALGILGNSYAIGRVIHKRGLDMTWTGWKTRELHFLLIQCLWDLFAVYQGIVPSKTGLFLMAVACGIYSLCRGFTKGRVIRGTAQILKI